GGTVSGPSVMPTRGRQWPRLAPLWNTHDGANSVATPVAIGDRVITVDSDGLLLALDARTGVRMDQLDLGVPVYSSPFALGEVMYIWDSAGGGHILRHSPKLKPIGGYSTASIYATPAFSENSFVVRTEESIERLAVSDRNLR